MAGATSSEEESYEDESAFLAAGFLGGAAFFFAGASSESELSLSDSESSGPVATFAGVSVKKWLSYTI